jgi:hypothetical protein
LDTSWGDGPELGDELGRPKARTQARNQASGNENEIVQLLLRLGTPLVVESTSQPSGEALAKFTFPFWAVAVQSATYPTGGALAKIVIANKYGTAQSSDMSWDGPERKERDGPQLGCEQGRPPERRRGRPAARR